MSSVGGSALVKGGRHVRPQSIVITGDGEIIGHTEPMVVQNLEDAGGQEIAADDEGGGTLAHV